MSRRVWCIVLLIMATISVSAAADRGSFHSSDGVSLSFLEAGRTRGPKNLTIALIPGWTMAAAIWRSQLDAFGRRYHTVAFDPRGQGEPTFRLPAIPRTAVQPI